MNIAHSSRGGCRRAEKDCRCRLGNIGSGRRLGAQLFGGFWCSTKPPGKTVRLRIHETERGQALLSATFCGDAKNLGTAALSACLLKFPFMTWKIVAGIHWEALKLWLKGARFHRSPPAPKPVSYHDENGAFEPSVNNPRKPSRKADAFRGDSAVG